MWYRWPKEYETLDLRATLNRIGKTTSSCCGAHLDSLQIFTIIYSLYYSLHPLAILFKLSAAVVLADQRLLSCIFKPTSHCSTRQPLAYELGDSR